MLRIQGRPAGRTVLARARALETLLAPLGASCSTLLGSTKRADTLVGGSQTGVRRSAPSGQQSGNAPRSKIHRSGVLAPTQRTLGLGGAPPQREGASGGGKVRGGPRNSGLNLQGTPAPTLPGGQGVLNPRAPPALGPPSPGQTVRAADLKSPLGECAGLDPFSATRAAQDNHQPQRSAPGERRGRSYQHLDSIGKQPPEEKLNLENRQERCSGRRGSGPAPHSLGVQGTPTRLREGVERLPEEEGPVHTRTGPQRPF